MLMHCIPDIFFIFQRIDSVILLEKTPVLVSEWFAIAVNVLDISPVSVLTLEMKVGDNLTPCVRI